MARNVSALLLLADGRFPAGGYAHSGGMEPAIKAGLVRDVETLEAFLRGRALTTGAVAAAFASASCAATAAGDRRDRLAELDHEFDARTPSPALRAASRRLGRQYLRAAGRIRPHPLLSNTGGNPHQPIALGVVGTVFGLGPQDAALAALHESVVGPATAAVRLLGIDPFDSHATLARMTSLLDELAVEAAAYAAASADELPAAAAPLLDIAAEQHASTGVRLFAS